MTSYRFYLDEKCTVWVRTYFTVEAPDRDTAASCAARIAKSDLHDTQRPEDGIAIDASETLYDSMEALPAEDNDDQPTREIFFENGDDVADNVSGPSWDAWWRQLDSGRKNGSWDSGRRTATGNATAGGRHVPKPRKSPSGTNAGNNGKQKSQ